MASNNTTPRQFRLGDDTLAEMDYLADRLGLTGRAEVIRHLCRRAVQTERELEAKEKSSPKRKKNTD